MTNPLVVSRLDEPKSPWAGIYLAEDIQLLVQGFESGSWIDGAIGGFGVAMDALGLVVDPLGTIVSWGVAWLMEHVKPLSDALDKLAGDPGQIGGHAATWTNMAGQLTFASEDYRKAVVRQVGDWAGSAGAAYRNHAGEQYTAIEALAKASEAMATITQGAGMLVALVRTLVRDLIADFVSVLAVRLWEWLAEEAFTLGIATPLVVAQVTALVGRWAAKIAHLIRGLLNSLKKLMPIIRKLKQIIEDLKKAIRRLRGKGKPHEPEPPTRPKRTPEEEAKRLEELGRDPATGRVRPSEVETAGRIERERGIELQRSQDPKVDWVDPKTGKTYDAVGNFPAQHFDQQWPNLQTRIRDHLDKADFVPVDVSKFTPDQVAKIERFIADNNLGPRAFLVGR